MYFNTLNGDQLRALSDTDQLFAARADIRARALGYSGSMSWTRVGGREYLSRLAAEQPGGVRKRKSLGPRSPETEALKQRFDDGKAQVADLLKGLEERAARQSAVNRALRLGRVPNLTAAIVRAVDEAGILGGGLRVVGTNSLYAYEAAAGVHFAATLATTEDVDLLFDSRARLRFVGDARLDPASLVGILKKVDRSFSRHQRTFTAINRDGFMVDLIKPMRNPPWRPDRDTIGGGEDLVASEIEGLVWLENAPSFEAVAIDLSGAPVRLVTVDPRNYAIHKNWIGRQPARNPKKRDRDLAQARAVAELVATRLLHLTFDAEALKMLPLELVEAAAPLFAGHAPPKIEW